MRMEQYIDHHQLKKLVMVNLHILWCNGREAIADTHNAPEIMVCQCSRFVVNCAAAKLMQQRLRTYMRHKLANTAGSRTQIMVFY